MLWMGMTAVLPRVSLIPTWFVTLSAVYGFWSCIVPVAVSAIQRRKRMISLCTIGLVCSPTHKTITPVSSIEIWSVIAKVTRVISNARRMMRLDRVLSLVVI